MIAAFPLLSVGGLAGCIQVATQPGSYNGPVGYGSVLPFGSPYGGPVVMRSCQDVSEPTIHPTVSLQAPQAEPAPVIESTPATATKTLPTPAPGPTLPPIEPRGLDDVAPPALVPDLSERQWKPVRSS